MSADVASTRERFVVMHLCATVAHYPVREKRRAKICVLCWHGALPRVLRESRERGASECVATKATRSLRTPRCSILDSCEYRMTARVTGTACCGAPCRLHVSFACSICTNIKPRGNVGAVGRVCGRCCESRQPTMLDTRHVSIACDQRLPTWLGLPPAGVPPSGDMLMATHTSHSVCSQAVGSRNPASREVPEIYCRRLHRAMCS